MKLRTWVRELDRPVMSIGIGDKRVAALEKDGERATSVWMREGVAWRELPLPARLKAHPGERDGLRIWFGRDDRPRVMGTRFTTAGLPTLVYWRWKGDWRDKPREIGRLDRDPNGTLFGILGHADPELVCRLADACIIKRVTGWTTVDAPNQALRVELAGSGAVGVGASGAFRLVKDAWRPFSEVPWTTPPGGLWVEPSGEAWVTEPGNDLVHREALRTLPGATVEDSAWISERAPCREPRGLWGTSARDVWLACADGAAHGDGSWRRLAEPSGAFEDVRGGPDGAVWLAGSSGVWRGTEP